MEYNEAASANDVYAIAKFARDILRRKHGRIEPPNTILYVEAAISSLYDCGKDVAARDAEHKDYALHPLSEKGIPFLRIFFSLYGSPDIQAEVNACLDRLNHALKYTLRVHGTRIFIPEFVVDRNRSVIFSLPIQQLRLFRTNWRRHDNAFLENWLKHPRDLSMSGSMSSMSSMSSSRFSSRFSSKPTKSSSKKPTMGGKKRKRANHTQRRRRWMRHKNIKKHNPILLGYVFLFFCFVFCFVLFCFFVLIVV